MRTLAPLIVDAIHKGAGLTKDDEADARRLLTACELALAGGRSGDVLPDIYRSRYRGPARPWLDIIAAAIAAADLDPIERAEMAGAFRVAAMVVEDGILARRQRGARQD